MAKNKNPLHKVTVNQSFVKAQAVEGPDEWAEALFRETTRTIRRLKLRGTADAQPFKRTPRNHGTPPTILDVRRWLDDLEKTPKYAADLDFLAALHATLKARFGDRAAEIAASVPKE